MAMDTQTIQKFVELIEQGHELQSGPFWCYHNYSHEGVRFVIKVFCEEPPEEIFYYTKEEFTQEIKDYVQDGMDEEAIHRFVNAHESKNPDDMLLAGCYGPTCGSKKDKLDAWSKNILTLKNPPV